MFCNATTPTNVELPTASALDLARPPGLRGMPALSVPAQLPVMRSKPAPFRGFPDQPDRTGMRERRLQSEITVGELQRRLGIDKEPSRHEQIMEAYGYQQMAELIGYLLTQGVRALQTLATAADFELGPRACAAAPVNGRPQTVDAFLGKFSRDFEFWVSPSARRAADMKGMIIVLGEDHYDHAIQKVITQVMLSFRRARGDRFFLEGDDPRGCAERIRKYVMEPDDCEFLEKDSTAFAALRKQQDAVVQKLNSCAKFIRQHAPAVRHESCDGNIVALTEFVRRHASKLHLSVRSEFQRMVIESNDLLEGLETMLPQFRSVRDRQMAAVLRQAPPPQGQAGQTFAVVGYAHLHALREYLQDLPCIVMLPKQIVERSPEFSLRSKPKQEL